MPVRYPGAVEAFQPSLLDQGALRLRAEIPTERIQLDASSWVDVSRGWLSGSDELLIRLVEDVPGRPGRRRMYDQVVDDPRLSYRYGADDLLPHPMLVECQAALAARYGVAFGSTGLNYYRDGHDSVAFHRDRELRHLETSLVAILTLGARRPFRLRRGRSGPSLDLAPTGGDLLVMGGHCQTGWYHGVPKVRHCGPRLSATWRWGGATTGTAT